jgi:hypothetical protein
VLCGSTVFMDAESSSIQLGRPFSPMLAASLPHQLWAVEPCMKGHPFAIEQKVCGGGVLPPRCISQTPFDMVQRLDHKRVCVRPLSLIHGGSVVWQVDGERLLCHKDGDKVGWLYILSSFPY